MIPQEFVGTWQLLSSEIRLADGTVVFPLGENAVGLLVLDQAGNLAAQLMHPDRPHFAGNDLLGGTPEEIATAYKGYVAFFGNFEIDPAQSMLSYTVRGSLFPNWIGHQQQRYFEFVDGQLVLRTPPMPVGGVEGTGVLTWQRIG